LTAESILKRAYGKKAKGSWQQGPELATIYRAARCKVCLIRENALCANVSETLSTLEFRV